MIISRYLIKEIIYTMLSLTIIVVFIFICNKFVRYLKYVASGKYAANMLIYVTCLQVPLLFGLLLPLGLFLGILLGYGRLYADSEMTVLSACGFSKRQLFMVTMKIAALTAIIVAVLIIWISPIIAKQRELIVNIAESSSIFQTIMPNYFQASKNGKRVFYVQKMATNRSYMKNLFIAQQSQPKPSKTGAQTWAITTAEKGYQITDKKTKQQFMVAMNGYRYKGIPGEKNYQLVKYKKYAIRLDTPSIAHRHEHEDEISINKLFKSATKNPNDMAELQWRISFPISTLILALLAVPLSRVNPRRGRFAQLIPAILIYVFYANMIFVSRNWLQAGTIPSWIGMWWIHVVMLTLALLLINKQTILKLK
jgi:lipopolysaccharide export system permease protein